MLTPQLLVNAQTRQIEIAGKPAELSITSVSPQTARLSVVPIENGQPSPLPQDGQGRLLLGELALEQFDFAAPLRPYLCASFAVTTYANRLGIGMHYDPSAMSESQARDLLASFVQQIGE